MAYRNSTTDAAFPRPASWFMRSRWPNIHAEKKDSAVTIISPRPIAETRNRIQMIGLYHSGCSRYGAMRNRDPSEDWWSEDSTIPMITSGIVAFLRRA